MNNIVKYLMETYHASMADDTQCSPFLEPGKALLFGLCLNDPVANYALLTEGDIASLGDAASTVCLKKRRSPFADMLLIFYVKDDGEVSFKLINGMGSRLFEELKDVCNKLRLSATP